MLFDSITLVSLLITETLRDELKAPNGAFDRLEEE
jgi:hypothetical protein